MTYEVQTLQDDTARLDAFLVIIKSFLVQASSITHGMQRAEFQRRSRDAIQHDRVHELGYVVQFISVMCPAHLHLIGELAIMLNDIDQNRLESRPHAQGKEAAN